jgi:hypothetical protein
MRWNQCCVRNSILYAYPRPLIDNSDINIEGYSIYRRDRNRQGGGVAIYINDQFAINRRSDLESVNIEMLWVEIKHNNKRILVGVCYRPPGQSDDDVSCFLDVIQNTFDSIFAQQFDFICLLGDFNDRCTTWHGEHISNDLGHSFYQLVEENRLTQTITEPTRYTDNSAYLLDLIITDSPLHILDAGVRAPLTNLDHCTVYCKTIFKLSHPKSYKRQVWDYKFANIDALDNAISLAPFDTILDESNTLHDAVSCITDLFITTCKEHIPNKTVTIRPKNKKWLTNDVRRAFRRRDRLFKRQKLSQRADHRLQYELARREANRLKRQAIRRYQNHILSTLYDKNTSQKKCTHCLKPS